MRRTWIYTRDSRYKDLEADMCEDIRLRSRFQMVITTLTTIVKIIHDKDRRRSLHLNTLDVQMNDLLTPIIQLFELLPDAQLFMKDFFGAVSIDPQYREHRKTQK